MKKKSGQKKRKKRILTYIVVGIVFFAAGALAVALLQGKGYQIKEWITSLREKGGQVKEWITKPSPPQEMKIVKLYFSDPAGEYLVPEERRIVASSQIEKEAKLILEELINGPKESSLNPTLPSETEIRAVYVKENCFYVDFSSSLKEKHPGGSTGELLTIYSIVNTLLDNFPSQSRVQILIQGEPAETLAGHIDIRNPLSKNFEVVK